MKICCKMFSVFLFFSCMHLNAQVNVPGDSLSAPSAFYTHELLLAGGSSFSGHFMAADKAKPSTCSRLFRESLYIGKQALLGPVFGFLFSLAGGFIGRGLDTDKSFFEAKYFFWGLHIGYIAGNAFGVNLAGNNQNYRGSFLAALAGAALGGYAGTKIYLNNSEIRAGGLAFYFGPTIGAIIGFNLFRKTVDSVEYSFCNFSVMHDEKNIYFCDLIVLKF